jgi:small subunit ribosomal protein S20
MANTASAKKAARQNEVRRQRNLRRRTAIKTAIKKVLLALENKQLDTVQPLFKDVCAKLARAKSKGVVHANTASRKISRIARRIAAVQSSQPVK